MSRRAAEREVIGPNGTYSLETLQGKERRVTHVADGKTLSAKNSKDAASIFRNLPLVWVSPFLAQ